MRKLSKLTESFKHNWESKVYEATKAVNISFNKAKQTSPYIIKYGRIPDLLVDKKLGLINKTESIAEVRTNRDQNFDHYAKKYIEKGKILCKYDLKPGDNVAIFKKELGQKLGTNWNAGYKIVEKILPDAYIVEKNGKNFRINKKHVKRV